MTYETQNPFINKFSIADKKLVKIKDSFYYDVKRNWIYVEEQIMTDLGADYEITMYRPWDLGLQKEVEKLKN